MHKIAISGKARSGKDTFSSLFIQQYINKTKIHWSKYNSVIIAASLADPIKEIIMTMFPKTDKDILYGASEKRSNIVPGVFRNEQPVTYRQLLQELGTEVGRSYKDTIWLDVMDHKIELAEQNNVELFIINDVRFKNEFLHLKNSGFKMIRIKRRKSSNMKHSSETEQNDILDNEFDFVINNNGTIENLYKKISKILSDVI